MTPEMRSLIHAVDVIQTVRYRLEREGAVTELRQLQGMSVDELDCLVRQELSLG